jgi:bifunctional ADP-heptose synthase (sugar kinase/adenylyltransferase)
MTVVADFGHGMFEGQALQALGDVKGHVGLNVQTNSSNFGFNPFTKHKRYDFLSIDTREARIAYHDRYTPTLELARKISSDIREKSALAITLGADGSCYFAKGTGDECSSPAFADQVIDATGAGDAFFGLSSVLVKVECPPTLIPFIGNIFAGLKTRIIGNKESVSKTQLLKAISTILK